MHDYESAPLHEDSPGPHVWSPSDAIPAERHKHIAVVNASIVRLKYALEMSINF